MATEGEFQTALNSSETHEGKLVAVLRTTSAWLANLANAMTDATDNRDPAALQDGIAKMHEHVAAINAVAAGIKEPAPTPPDWPEDQRRSSMGRPAQHQGAAQFDENDARRQEEEAQKAQAAANEENKRHGEEMHTNIQSDEPDVPPGAPYREEPSHPGTHEEPAGVDSDAPQLPPDSDHAPKVAQRPL
jgi:hypothetical protein